MPVASYKELIAWQKAMDLVEVIYIASKAFPRDELYGLTDQAAVSVPSNIAEGQARRSTKEFLNHLSIAYGSLSEVETQLLIAQRLSYVTDQQALPALELIREVGRIINGLLNSLTTDH